MMNAATLIIVLVIVIRGIRRSMDRRSMNAILYNIQKNRRESKR
jgi:hypothetical protein